jgi:hypothetical protein
VLHSGAHLGHAITGSELVPGKVCAGRMYRWPSKGCCVRWVGHCCSSCVWRPWPLQWLVHLGVVGVGCPAYSKAVTSCAHYEDACLLACGWGLFRWTVWHPGVVVLVECVVVVVVCVCVCGGGVCAASGVAVCLLSCKSWTAAFCLLCVGVCGVGWGVWGRVGDLG